MAFRRGTRHEAARKDFLFHEYFTEITSAPLIFICGVADRSARDKNEFENNLYRTSSTDDSDRNIMQCACKEGQRTTLSGHGGEFCYITWAWKKGGIQQLIFGASNLMYLT